MKYRFYDPKLHRTDWDAMRAKYKPLLAFVADRQKPLNLINEMIGELIASHTGASTGRERGAGAPACAGAMTRHLRSICK
jgi:tricorn protease